MDNLPNGFTGFSHRPEGFVSAGEASRMSRGAMPTRAVGSASTSSTVGESLRYARSIPSTNDHLQEMPFDEVELERISDLDQRRAWVEVDLSAIRHNVAATRRLMQSRCRLMAVVKADGYGHGAVEVAKAALGAGADRLAVATVEEGVQLRRAGVSAPILLLSQPPVESIPLLVAHHITPSVYEPDFTVAYGEEADLHGMKAPFQLAINTGMNRIGVHYADVVEFLHMVSFHRALELEGVFTQFATAASSETLGFQMQKKRFNEAVDQMRAARFDPGIVHAANSAALYRYPDVHFDMVRMGSALYGLHPCPQTRSIVSLRPAMSVHARIVDARMLGVSEGVSFGLHYRSPGSVTVCTVPIGYADGLRFGLSGRIDFIMDGRYYRQVGDICADHSMFEVDMRRTPMRERIEPQIGDEVLIVGSQGAAEVTLDELASKLGTINSELAMGFGARLPRRFV